MSDDLLRDDRRCRDAFRRGERWAMEQAYHHYLPLVRAIVTHGFGGFRGFADPLDREDATQTIFAAAFEERTRLRYDGLQPYTPFLRGLAHNVVRQMLAKRTRFERTPDAPEEDPATVEDTLIADELAALCRTFRASLDDPTDLELLDRYFVDGWAEERLAEHLGLTRYRTRKRIAKLHKRMTRFLAAHGVTAV